MTEQELFDALARHGGNLPGDPAAYNTSPSAEMGGAFDNFARNPGRPSWMSFSNTAGLPWRERLAASLPTLRGIPGALSGGMGAVRSGIGSTLGAVGRYAPELWTGPSLYNWNAGAFSTPTEAYRARFGLQDDDPSVAGDVGVRALGAASDLAPSFIPGLHSLMFGDAQAAQPPGALDPGAHQLGPDEIPSMGAMNPDEMAGLPFAAPTVPGSGSMSLKTLGPGALSNAHLPGLNIPPPVPTTDFASAMAGAGARAAKTLGINPADLEHLTEPEKAQLFMSMGLRMLQAGGQGQHLMTAVGTAGLPTLEEAQKLDKEKEQKKMLLGQATTAEEDRSRQRAVEQRNQQVTERESRIKESELKRTAAAQDQLLPAQIDALRAQAEYRRKAAGRGANTGLMKPKDWALEWRASDAALQNENLKFGRLPEAQRNAQIEDKMYHDLGAEKTRDKSGKTVYVFDDGQAFVAQHN